jgi:sigma-B regulation protein RsbU (phosphoserine phosphatase)
MRQTKAIPQRILLSCLLTLLVACMLVFYANGAAAVLQRLLHGTTTVQTPFTNGNIPTQIDSVTPAATAAGIHRNDTLLTIDGQPFRSGFQLLARLRAAHAGDLLPLTIASPGGPARAVTLRLAPVQAVTPSLLYRFTIEILLRLVFPLACILLGAWVVAAKPRDPNAWLLLGIFFFFPTTLLFTFFYAGPLAYLALVVGNVANSLGPIWVFLFGIYFPQRSLFDLRRPWLKWIPILYCGFALLVTEIFLHGYLYNFASVAWMVPHGSHWFLITQRIQSLLGLACFSAFFFLLAHKLSTTTDPDARRRLRVLFWGCNIGCLPALLVSLIQLARNRPFDQDLPQWLLLIVFVTFTLFPLTLAYVVVVQRAMDVRILIRQGTRYALARRSLMVLRILLAIGISWALTVYFQHAAQFHNPQAHGLTPAQANHIHTADLIRVGIVTALFLLFRFGLSARLQLAIDQKFFREAYSAEQLLAELADEVRSFTEADPLLHTVTDRISQTLHIPRIAVFLRSGDTFRLQSSTGILAPFGSAMDGVSVYTLPAASSTITNLSRSKSPANVYQDDPSAWLLEASDAERAALAALSTELLVPLPGRGRLAGVIALGPKQSEEPYSKSDRHLLQTVASQTGLALENAELLRNLSVEVSQRERISREIEIAREVQERLFPQSYPQVPGIDLAGFCRPAQAVGGDYYDFFLIQPDVDAADIVSTATRHTATATGTEAPVSEGQQAAALAAATHSATNTVTNESAPRLAIAIGDISGKGIAAALLMASLRASLRSLALTQSGSLAVLVQYLNRLVYDSSSSSRYATFFYAEYDPSTRRLTYVNAGHNAPCLLRAAHPGHAIRLEPTGTVIGLLPNAVYTQATLHLAPGDVLIAFTDGISEAMTHAPDNFEAEWGEDRLMDCAHTALAQSPRPAADSILHCILHAADTFTAGAPQHDDMTLLVCTF